MLIQRCVPNWILIKDNNDLSVKRISYIHHNYILNGVSVRAFSRSFSYLKKVLRLYKVLVNKTILF